MWGINHHCYSYGSSQSDTYGSTALGTTTLARGVRTHRQGSNCFHQSCGLVYTPATICARNKTHSVKTHRIKFSVKAWLWRSALQLAC